MRSERLLSTIFGAAAWLALVLIAAAPGCALPDREGRENLIGLSPLISYQADASGDSWGLNVLAGLYQRDVHPRGSSSNLFPFWFSSAGPGEENRFVFLFPLYYRNREPFREDTFFFLFGVQEKGDRVIYHPLWPFIRYAPPGGTERWNLFLFPLLDLESDGDRGSLVVLDLLGLARLYGLRWGDPPPPGKTGARGEFQLLDMLGLFQLAGGSDRGAYEDFQLVTLFGNERLSLYQRHWRREGGDGRTVLFPFYWHLQDPESEVLHLFPFFSRSHGDGWTRTGVLCDLAAYRSSATERELTLFWILPIRWSADVTQPAEEKHD